jgi:hypothetical protein
MLVVVRFIKKWAHESIFSVPTVLSVKISISYVRADGGRIDFLSSDLSGAASNSILRPPTRHPAAYRP